MSEHHKIFVAAYLILKRDDMILLLHRKNTGYEDGKYSLPAGHLEKGEQPTEAAIREAKEEAGIDALPENIRCVHIMHRADDGQSGREYDDFFFVCDTWSGEPTNAEPEKCDGLGWFPIDNLPDNTISYIASAIKDIQANRFYSER